MMGRSARPGPRRILLALGVAATLTGTAGLAARQQPSTPGPPGPQGTLRQQEIAVGIDAGAVRFLILPLDESVTRLLAPDTHGALRAVLEAKQDEVSEVARRHGAAAPTVFLVQAFGVGESGAFEPDQLTIVSQNRYFTPLGVVAVSPRWSEHRVPQRETATALFVYEAGIDLWAPFTVGYREHVSFDWTRSVRQLERERARLGRRPG